MQMIRWYDIPGMLVHWSFMHLHVYMNKPSLYISMDGTIKAQGFGTIILCYVCILGRWYYSTTVSWYVTKKRTLSI